MPSITNDEILRSYQLSSRAILSKLSMYSRFSSIGRDLIIERQYELFFMRFENLIESTFLAYANGQKPISGQTITRFVIHDEIENILGLVSGGKEYPDWTRWDYTRREAKLFFSPSPFEPLKHYEDKLNEIKAIRNALAHISLSSQSKYETVVRKRMGYYPADGLSFSAFLLHRVPEESTKIFFQEYVDSTILVAEQICGRYEFAD